MTPEYKLTYFNLTALAEPIRWMFKFLNVPFEDERIGHYEWPELRSKFPLEQLPILTLKDGRELTQSSAIYRFLARKHGLEAEDEFLKYRVDQVTHIVDDGRCKWRDQLMSQNTVEEVMAYLTANVSPKVKIDLVNILKQLESIVTETEGDFIAGKKLTYADFVLANWLLIWMNTVILVGDAGNLFHDFPNLARQMKAVLAIPEIATWIQERPACGF